jgi:hypothetical protein
MLVLVYVMCVKESRTEHMIMEQVNDVIKPFLYKGRFTKTLLMLKMM